MFFKPARDARNPPLQEQAKRGMCDGENRSEEETTLTHSLPAQLRNQNIRCCAIASHVWIHHPSSPQLGRLAGARRPGAVRGEPRYFEPVHGPFTLIAMHLSGFCARQFRSRRSGPRNCCRIRRLSCLAVSRKYENADPDPPPSSDRSPSHRTSFPYHCCCIGALDGFLVSLGPRVLRRGKHRWMRGSFAVSCPH